MKSDFQEDWVSDSADELDRRTIDFDWPEVERVLDGVRQNLSDSEFERLGTALAELFHWVIGDPKTPKGCERIIARRLIGLAWCLRPDFFEGSPSLSTIASRLGVNKVHLSIHSADAHRTFGIKNRGQSHGSGKFKETDALSADNPDQESEHNDESDD